MTKFHQLGLWKRAFEALGEQPEAADRLVSAYKQFWKRAVQLADQIQKDVPGLTLHDETHFEALWRVADQIAGADYRLSPLETFVFGGAILLHDAANTVAAFPGG